MCPYCKHKTIWKFTKSEEEEYGAYIVCEICGNIMLKVPVIKEQEDNITYTDKNDDMTYSTSGYSDTRTDEEIEYDAEIENSAITTTTHN